MKRSDVYLGAAAIMYDEAHPCGCCNAIAKAINGLKANDGHYCGHLGEEYDHRKKDMELLFGNDQSYWWQRPPRDRKHRVLALCFMAAITASSR